MILASPKPRFTTGYAPAISITGAGPASPAAKPRSSGQHAGRIRQLEQEIAILSSHGNMAR